MMTEEDHTPRDLGLAILTMPEWLAREKGLV